MRDLSDSSEGLEQKDTSEETGSAKDTKVRVALYCSKLEKLTFDLSQLSYADRRNAREKKELF